MRVQGAAAAALLATAAALAALQALVAHAQPSEGSEYKFRVKIRVDYTGQEGSVILECIADVRAVVDRVSEDSVAFRVYYESSECSVDGDNEDLIREIESEVKTSSTLEAGVKASTAGEEVVYPRDSVAVDYEDPLIPLYVEPRLLDDGRLSDSDSISFFTVTLSYTYDLRYDNSGVLRSGWAVFSISTPEEDVDYTLEVERASALPVPSYIMVFAAAVALAAIAWMRSRR